MKCYLTMKYYFMNACLALFLFIFLFQAPAGADQKGEKVVAPVGGEKVVAPVGGEESSGPVLVRGEKSSGGEQRAQTVKAGNKTNTFSFQPLLIQGKKRLIQKTKDLKVESDDIASSELFFVDIDFKERIFESENLLK